MRRKIGLPRHMNKSIMKHSRCIICGKLTRFHHKYCPRHWQKIHKLRMKKLYEQKEKEKKEREEGKKEKTNTEKGNTRTKEGKNHKTKNTLPFW